MVIINTNFRATVTSGVGRREMTPGRGAQELKMHLWDSISVQNLKQLQQEYQDLIELRMHCYPLQATLSGASGIQPPHWEESHTSPHVGASQRGLRGEESRWPGPTASLYYQMSVWSSLWKIPALAFKSSRWSPNIIEQSKGVSDIQIPVSLLSINSYFMPPSFRIQFITKLTRTPKCYSELKRKIFVYICVTESLC